FEFIGRWVLQHQHKAIARRRPRKIIHVLNRVGELLRFSAAAVQEPNLLLTFLALREKREIFSVWTPSRMRRRHALRGERYRFAAACRHHPDSLFVFVLF